MRRLLAVLAGAAVLGGGTFAATGGAQTDASDASGGGEYRVDAIFDTAKGIIPGQLVKVAGARVGEVKDVQLTDDFNARIQLEVDGRFAPFKADARCDIQPEGLISENFVQCDPGTADAEALRGENDQAPTVPLERTAVPVNLTDLFEIFETPTRDRLRVLLNSLGAGVAARGEDLNRLLRRSNPTLGAVNDTLTILNDQKAVLQDAITQTHLVTKELAKDPQAITDFVADSRDVLQRTSRRRDDLRAGIRKLPPTLAAVRPALTEFEEFAAESTPLLARLEAAAPQLDGLLRTIQTQSSTALPAIRALGTTSTKGRATAKVARPVVQDLRSFATAALPTGNKLAPLLQNLRERGFIENLLGFVYQATAGTARYDGTSHYLPAHMLLSSCGFFSTTPAAGCDVNYNAAARAPQAARTERRAEAKTGRETKEQPKGSTTPAPALPELPEVTKPATDLVPKVTEPVKGIVDGILDGIGGVLKPKDGKPQTDIDEAKGLLDFLLG